MNNGGINLYPLYWIHHDSWINRSWGWWYGWTQSSLTSRHRGHLHFFMPGYPIKDNSATGQAYSGNQKYDFSLESIWGPDSRDPNQSENVKYVGTPKWYFEITEYWRRIYIQPWEDSFINGRTSGIVGKVGIKYDASHAKHTYGPFREGQDYFFYWNRSARTLPIEYFLDEKKRSRNNYLNGTQAWYIPQGIGGKDINYDVSNSDSNSTYMRESYIPVKTRFWIPNGDLNDGFVDRPLAFRINAHPNETTITQAKFEKWKNVAFEIGATFVQEGQNIKYSYDGLAGSANSSDEQFGAFNTSAGDLRYIFPIIEYQEVKHLNWERLPGFEYRDNSSAKGDGLSISVTLPYTVDGDVQSPFSDSSKTVYPIGTYCHGFEQKFPDRVLKYPKYDKIDEGNYQWVIVKTVNEEEVVSRVITVNSPISTNPPTPSETLLEEGESFSTFLKDEDGDPIFSKTEGIQHDEYRIPDELKGKKIMFNVPDGMPQDGKWVEQCFGGVIRAKAVVKIIDNFGEEKEVEVSTTKFFLNELFEGKDQNGAAT